jgi:hypothetical protein
MDAKRSTFFQRSLCGTDSMDRSWPTADTDCRQLRGHLVFIKPCPAKATTSTREPASRGNLYMTSKGYVVPASPIPCRLSCSRAS